MKLFLALLFVVSGFAANKNERPAFRHFILRQFVAENPLAQNIFRSDKFYHLELFDEDVFLKTLLRKDRFGRYIPDSESNQKWFLDYPEREDFPEIAMERKYYYDSKARSHNRILVLLYGTLWIPESRQAMTVLKQLYEFYSKNELNNRILSIQFHRWFKDKTRALNRFKSMTELIELEKDLNQFPEENRKKLYALYSTNHGGLLFWPFPLDSKPFVHANEVFKVMSSVPYNNDVVFAFVVTSANYSDGQAFLKDNELPFPLLDDYSAEKSEQYVVDHIPVMVIVDHRGKIAYHGDVRSYKETKNQIDSLLLDIYDEVAEKRRKDNYRKLLREWELKEESRIRREKVEAARKRLEEQKAIERKRSLRK